MEDLALTTSIEEYNKYHCLGTIYNAITVGRVPGFVWTGHLAEEVMFELEDD